MSQFKKGQVVVLARPHGRPQVKGGERWRVQIGGNSYIRAFERGLSPPALASAALDMAQDKFEFKSKNPSMLTGKLPNGDLLTLMRME